MGKLEGGKEREEVHCIGMGNNLLYNSYFLKTGEVLGTFDFGCKSYNSGISWTSEFLGL